MERTKCSSCEIESTSQPEGDGCHVCLSGHMIQFEESTIEDFWEMRYDLKKEGI